MPYVNLPPRSCARCGVEFKPKQRPDQLYCSRLCANTVRNQAGRKEPETRVCVHCGASFVVAPSKKKKTCSRSCASAVKWAQYVPGPKKTPPSKMPEYRRARYQQIKDRRNTQNRERYRTDETYREKIRDESRRRRREDAQRVRAQDKARVDRGYASRLKKAMGACQHCGYDRYLGALEWHHRDPSKKTPGGFRTKARAVVEQELADCVLLCANCHKELHHGIWRIEEIVGEPSIAGEPEASGGPHRLAPSVPQQSAAR